jgi:BRCA1-associated protein
LQADLDEEKELNKCLVSNQEINSSKINKLEEKLKRSDEEKEREISDLKLQLKDIMFYLDAQAKFSESKDVSKEELQDSHLVIQQDESSAGASGNSKAQSSSAKAASRRKRK